MPFFCRSRASKRVYRDNEYMDKEKSRRFIRNDKRWSSCCKSRILNVIKYTINSKHCIAKCFVRVRKFEGVRTNLGPIAKQLGVTSK